MPDLSRPFRFVTGNPYLLLTLTTFLWGGNGVAAKLVVGEVSPMVVVCLRWVIVCLALALLFRREIEAGWRELVPHWRSVALMAFFGYTAFNALFYTAGHYTTGVNITLLQGAIPIVVLIGSALVFRTPIRLHQAVGILVTLIGVAVVATQGDLTRLASFSLNIGDVLIMIACVFYSSYTIALRRRPPIPQMVFFTGLALAAFLTTLPMIAIELVRGTDVWPTTPKAWAVMLYIALGPSLLSQLTFMRGVELIGPSRAGIFVNLVPIFGAGLSVAILGEPFGVYHAVALALVLGGIFLSERTVRAPIP